jgi:hypothetical protein
MVFLNFDRTGGLIDLADVTTNAMNGVIGCLREDCETRGCFFAPRQSLPAPAPEEEGADAVTEYDAVIGPL